MKSFHKTSLRTIALVSGVMLASLALGAGPKAGKPDAEFTAMDANKDGKVFTEEHPRASRKMFVTMCANADGKVTTAEMDAAHERVTGKKAKRTDMSSADKIKAIDTDGDGILPAEVHAAGSRSMFEKMGTDKDGFLTGDELAAGHAQMLKKR
jgi:Ca2+-binding EF-hand superfamily protein